MAKYTIGLMLNGIETEYGFLILNGVEKYCNENDIDFYVFVARSQKFREVEHSMYLSRYFALSGLFTQQNIDALLVTGTTNCIFPSKKDYYQFLKENKSLNIISIDEEYRGISSLTVNNRNVFKKLTEHLIKKHNCKKFLLVHANSSAKDMIERAAGFYDALEKNNIPKQNVKVIDIPVYASNTQICNYFVDYKSPKDITFDVIVCLNDLVAIQCIEYLTQRGIRIPEDVLVTGFDNIPASFYCEPKLTTVDQQFEIQGYEAAALAIKNKENKCSKDKVVRSKIIYRASCGCKVSRSISKKMKDTRLSVVETKYLKLRDKMHFIQDSLFCTENTTNMEDLRKSIFEQLKMLGVSIGIIILYEKPVKNREDTPLCIPDSAYVYLYYRETDKQYVKSSDVYFNPKEMLIPPLIELSNHKRITMSLSDRNLIFGYAIFCPSEFDFLIYPLFVGIISKLISATYDFSKLAEKTNVLESISYTDEMTQVLNRRGLFTYGQELITKTVEEGKYGLVIFGDMDGLKSINDTYGHEAGDKAIKAEIDIMRKAFYDVQIIARYGGDEFVLIAEGMSSAQLERKKEKIKNLSEEWNLHSGEKYKLSISIGFTVFGKDSCNLEKLITLADSSQYEEKRKHKKLLKKHL